MESIDKAIECVFQSLLLIEETSEKMMETTQLEKIDSQGMPSHPSVTRIDTRIDRLMGINTRLQDVHIQLSAVVTELDKI